MALRSVLRLLLPSGPRIVPVHGISTAARFMNTGSQVKSKTIAEQGSIRLSNQHFIDAQKKYEKDFAQLEAARQSLEKFTRAVAYLKKVQDAVPYVVVVNPLIMITGPSIMDVCFGILLP